MMSDWPDIAGRNLPDGGHVLAVRVYYEDTDFSGAVYHANYLKFCERARSDMLRISGIHHAELHGAGAEGRMGFVVRRMECDFLKPAHIDDLLHVETHRLEAAGARLVLKQMVKLGEDVIFSADVTIALVDGRGVPKRLPKDLLERLKR
jgi:acyl-CoA thioester hydrolase